MLIQRVLQRRKKIHYPMDIMLFFLLFSCSVLFGRVQLHAFHTENNGIGIGVRKAKCNLFSGKWVHDDSYPLYTAADCPYISTEINCRGNGRPDSDYEKWRWQPNDCTIPRFNSNEMLNRLRGKRLMFVGDCISRGQFESMVCLLQGGIPSNKKSFVRGNSLSTFKALDYDATIQFFWAPYLVEVESNKEGKTVLQLDSIENNGMYWKGADFLVFESSHWWDHFGGSSGQTWDVIIEGNKTYYKIDHMVAYRKALITWSNWASSQIDFQKTKLFFRTMSPRHSNCMNEREPNPGKNSTPLAPQEGILKQVLSSTKFAVGLVEIEGMCDERKDGHPWNYDAPNGGGNGDCSHWCLPGVPDSWNDLLYSSLA